MLNFTGFVQDLIQDVCLKVPSLSHIDPSRVAVAASGRFEGNHWGNLACCIALKERSTPAFSVWTTRGAKVASQVSTWTRQHPVEVIFDGVKCKYLVLLRLPRLFKHDPLETIIHELYHIGENFDGTLRPLKHGQLFDWRVRCMMRQWMETGDPELVRISRLTLEDIHAEFGSLLVRSLPNNFRPSITEAVEDHPTYEEGIEKLYPGFRLSANYKIKPTELTPASVPRIITEKDCSLRAYHKHGVETLPTACLRYLDRPQLRQAG